MAEVLVEKHGVQVIPGKLAPGAFLRKIIEQEGGNHRFSGTLEELTALVEKHFSSWEPGTGSHEGDVRLVRLPVEGFFTNIVPITEENAASVRLRWEARVPGEAPVAKLVIPSDDVVPASVVKIVVYRADVLARDAGRSSDAEWEIIAILADPAEAVPMHPATMLRNFYHETGGTYREYTPEEWAAAECFWATHVYLEAPAAPEKS